MSFVTRSAIVCAYEPPRRINCYRAESMSGVALVGAALAITLDFDDDTPQIATPIMSPIDIDKISQSKSLRIRAGVRRDI
jgi:hypothetical protein